MVLGGEEMRGETRMSAALTVDVIILFVWWYLHKAINFTEVRIRTHRICIQMHAVTHIVPKKCRAQVHK